MSYNFYVLPNGNDLNSGSSNTIDPKWSGKISAPGNNNILTKTEGDDFTSVSNLVGQFIRIPATNDGTDVNLRITEVVSTSVIKVAENLTKVCTEKAARIGGALATPKAAIGFMDGETYRPSVIPYCSASASVNLDINIHIPRTESAWIIDKPLKIMSSAQDSIRKRRRILGYAVTPFDGGFVFGYFGGPTFEAGEGVTTILDVAAKGISILGIRYLSSLDDGILGVNANNSKDGIYVAQCIFDNTVCQANLYTDLTGCRFEGVISSAWLTNCTVNRCLFDGCDIGLDIEATVINEGIFRNCVTAFAQIEPAGANDFKNSDFYGNPLTPIFMAAGAVAPVTTFTLCDFEYWPTIGQAAVVFRHCTCKGATVNPDPVYVPFTNETVTYPYSGQDDHMGLWPEGVNKQFRDWPDPVLSKICYESVGVHGCAVPVELYQNRRAARIGLTDEHLGL